ncbi:hypothetical protein SDC9_195405 [bioreactor metagenome]|uniref:Uncharacterized protein n=1 Tax=bioreactor metagenome TaxID=1076179 RepID=A0A645I902_9ZZZZ
MLLAGSHNEVLRCVVLEHEPHALDIVFGISPVAQGIHVAQFQMILQALGDAPSRQGNFPGHEVLSATL